MSSTTSTNVAPPGFAKASAAYRFRVWMALLGLLLFVLLYLGLASWFTYTAYWMFAGAFAGGDGAAPAFFVALPSAFLAVFMWKALFFVRTGSQDPGLEITASDQPELYAFLRNLADQVGAPRPHRVFISPDVNACVFYDLSILNFLLPSRKNLIIGLGLVNSLDRSELKAVLAHEFGHFAQRSMAVGKWVYVGEQIAGHMISKRDFLDKTLDTISAIDVRIAWIGWIMRTIVWSIRSLMETVFRAVVLAHRALSREMEFQADLVAVSVTGSDALVRGLYRLQGADEDWQLSLEFANKMLVKELQVTDLFAVQTRIREHLRRILDEPQRGLVPKPGNENPADRRLFTDELAQPPRMWATHPPNTEREENAKRTYVPAPLDETPAWSLFCESQKLREEVTELLFKDIQFEQEPTPLSVEEAQEKVDELYLHESYDNAYRGAYLGRSVTIGVEEAQQLYADPAADELPAKLQRLYPESLHESVTEWRKLDGDAVLLEAIEDGVMDAPGGVVRHRGRVVPRVQLPQLREEVNDDRDAVRERIEAHDRDCRTTHLAAAGRVAKDWQEYLRSLTHLLHYAEHSEADLTDAHGHLANVTTMTTAKGRVSKRELHRILTSANGLQYVMKVLDRQAQNVALPTAVREELEIESWREGFEKLELPAADDQNISQWMSVVDSWAIPMIRALGALRKAALAELLRTEKHVRRLLLDGNKPQAAPEPARVPTGYATRKRGSERPRQKKLDWWSRFTLADGLGPASLRFAAAAAIVAAVVLAGAYVGNSDVAVYNGLQAPVSVQIGGSQRTIGPSQHIWISMKPRRTYQVTAATADGELIESFEARVGRPFSKYVYNVTGAAPMVEWTATYGAARERQPNFLGFPRWRSTKAQHVFQTPPRQVSTSGSGSTRLVLQSAGAVDAYQMLPMAKDPAERERVIRAHARWDSPQSPDLNHWLRNASELDDFDEILDSRLRANATDVVARRLRQDLAGPDERDRICKEDQELASQHPDNPDWQYLDARAMPGGPEQDIAFLEGRRRWPNNQWFVYAAGSVHSGRAEWEEALACYESLLDSPGPLYDAVALQVARIRRVAAAGEPAKLDDLRDSTELNQMLMLEDGQLVKGTPAAAYSLLDQGRLEEAHGVAGDPIDPRLLVLLAASKGAPEPWQQQALATPLEELEDPLSLLYLAALAVRKGQPSGHYLAEFDKRYPQDRKSPADFVRQLIAAGSPDDLDELDGLSRLDTLARGAALAAAAAMCPERAPESWKTKARALLFAVERPAF